MRINPSRFGVSRTYRSNCMADAGLRRGIDLGGTKLLILDQDAAAGEPPRVRRYATGPAFTPADLIALVEALPAAACTGVAVPGLVNGSGEVAESDVLPAFTGWSAPSGWRILNDGEAGLLSTAPFAHEVSMVVGVGTGIVSSLQVGGRRLRGLRPFAGEFGHMPLGTSGQTLDDAASGAAILRRAGGAAPEAIHTALREGQAPHLREILREAGEALGAGLAMLIQVIHPEWIGLYGGTLQYPGYLDAALQATLRLTDAGLRRQCAIEMLPDPHTAVARGALRAGAEPEE